MKTSAIWAAATLIAAGVGVQGLCLAGEKPTLQGANILGALAGSVVPTAELGRQHARGSTNINLNSVSGGDGSSFDNGMVRGNSVIGTSATGMILTNNSVNNNTGFTTVFQNSGNNSLFQQSTSINISLH